MYIDQAGWAQKDSDSDPRIALYPSVRCYELQDEDGRPVNLPKGVGWHYTAGQGDGNVDYDISHPDHSAEDLAKRIQSYGQRSASWHFLIAKCGDIFQSVSVRKGSWHIGKSGKIDGKQFANVNRCLVGIEMENAGRLKKVNGVWYCWPYTKTPSCVIAEDRAADSGKGWFDKFTKEQEESAILLLGSLVDYCSLTVENCFYEHVQFDPTNREDPGPLWHDEVMPRIQAAVFDSVILE